MFVSNKGPVVLFTCFAVALFWAGCSPDDERLTKTEEMRLTLDPKVKAFLLQGEEAYQRGMYPYALALVDSAEKYAPELADVYFLRGSIYTALNQLDAARGAYKRVIDLDPDYPGAHMNMGDNEFQLGKLRDALLLYVKEGEIAPTSPLYVQMGHIYTELGVADSARMAYERAIALDSTNAAAYMWYGQLHEKTGDLEAALAYSRKGLALRPEDPNYRFMLGAQLFHSGHLEEAARYLKQAAHAGPLHYPALYNLGQVLMRLGREEEANRYLAQADSTRQFLHRITLAEEAASRNPGIIENWTRLGDLFHMAGMYDRALEAFSVAATIQPSNLSLQNNIAETIMATGNTSEAIRRFQAILSADETLVDVWLNLGLAQAIAGDCDEARHSWETALRYRPGDATVKGHLAALCKYIEQ